ncbi:MAG: EVE domain-containing protein [Ignavibacteriales bacterium]|nr:EVE domain-containing protein [Ignavibacteriales bacterium]
MNYWLIKFAPFRYSWNDCLKNGRFEIYSVRSPQACVNLKKMKLGDRVLFYHSQKEKQVMGSMKVIEEAHQDPTTKNPQWVSVTFEPVETFKYPVTLQQIKALPELKNIGLIKQPRLAVLSLLQTEYECILRMGKVL